MNEKGWSVEREEVGWRGKGEGGRQMSDKVNEKGWSVERGWGGGGRVKGVGRSLTR